jgi:hypothetical protein
VDDRIIDAFRSEVATQCEFVLIAATELDYLMSGAPKAQQAAEAEAYRAANPHDVQGYAERLRGEPVSISMARKWLALQSILVSAANISKLLWGSRGEGSTERQKARAPLRELLEVEQDSPLYDLRLRNDFEHFDERLERWLSKATGQQVPYVGRNIWHAPEGVTMIAGEAEHRRFGHYDPVTATVSFWTHSVDLRSLIAEVDRILPLAEKLP